MAPRPFEIKPWLIATIIALMGYAASGISGYTSVSNRISALEAHQIDNQSRLDRMESKIDAILTGISALGKGSK